MSRVARTVSSAVKLLVAYRMAVYLGGLAVIGAPLAFAEVGVVVPPDVRTALVAATLAVMVVTYAGERRYGIDPGGSDGVPEAPGDDDGPAYSLRMRAAVSVAVAGLAVGVYVALSRSVLGGLLFVVGAYFFAYIAFRGELDEADADGGSA